MNRIIALALLVAAVPLSAHGRPMRHRHRPLLVVGGPFGPPRVQVRVRPCLPPRPRVVVFLP